MFDINFLHEIRDWELQKVVREYFTDKSLKILEIGGGTGYQAKMLTEMGYSVVSIDMPSSSYSEHKCYDVIDYDGHHIPFADKSFDIVFSSNVLEHVPHLDEFEAEIKRVLKDDGFALHIMPTPAWRFFTTITHYLESVKYCFRIFGSFLIKKATVAQTTNNLTHHIKNHILIRRHGERGCLCTEMVYFSAYWWKKHFVKNGFQIVKVAPMGLIYTGYMLFGKRLSLNMRTRLSKIFGSSVNIYVVKIKK